MTDMQNDRAGATLIETIDPEMAARFTSRRDLLPRAAARLGMAATVPAMLAVASREALGQGVPAAFAEILNFALTLEYLEAEFYRTALAVPGLIPARHRPVFAQIARHEAEHVRTLRAALGPAAVENPRFDYTARGKYPDVFRDFGTFAAVSSTFEDLGVAAYKGQAPALLGTPTLTVALRIHSVEARHAAEVRRVRGVLGFDGPVDAPLSKAEVLINVAPFLAG